MNYIYGTWSALVRAERGRRRAMHRLPCGSAVGWLISIQNEDGGWGEDGSSYKLDYRGYERRQARRRKPPGRFWG